MKVKTKIFQMYTLTKVLLLKFKNLIKSMFLALQGL